MLWRIPVWVPSDAPPYRNATNVSVDSRHVALVTRVGEYHLKLKIFKMRLQTKLACLQGGKPYLLPLLPEGPAMPSYRDLNAAASSWLTSIWCGMAWCMSLMYSTWRMCFTIGLSSVSLPMIQPRDSWSHTVLNRNLGQAGTILSQIICCPKQWQHEDLAYVVPNDSRSIGVIWQTKESGMTMTSLGAYCQAPLGLSRATAQRASR